MPNGGSNSRGAKIGLPASDILAKIASGVPVDYDNVIIEGDLDIRVLSLPKDDKNRLIIASQIRIINSEFSGGVYFILSRFNENISFRGTNFNKGAEFIRSKFRGEADFTNTKFIGLVTNFNGAEFNGKAKFTGTQFSGLATSFDESEFNGHADFMLSKFSMFTSFSKSRFIKGARFDYSRFGGDAYFNESWFSGETWFLGSQFNGMADFGDSQFSGDIKFTRSKFNGEVLRFKGAKFKRLEQEEDAYRRAKNVSERAGDRVEAGMNFYREMEVKRMQKPWYYRYPEFVLVQLIFGYGVHPWWLMGWWMATILVFASLYHIGSGIYDITQLFESIKFSFATAVAPGYIATIVTSGNTTGYHLTPLYQTAAMVETVFGTFMWAGFIATFARKYMR